MCHFGDYGLLRFRTAKMVMRVISLLNETKPPNADRRVLAVRCFFLRFNYQLLIK